MYGLNTASSIEMGLSVTSAHVKIACRAATAGMVYSPGISWLIRKRRQDRTEQSTPSALHFGQLGLGLIRSGHFAPSVKTCCKLHLALSGDVLTRLPPPISLGRPVSPALALALAFRTRSCREYISGWLFDSTDRTQQIPQRKGAPLQPRCNKRPFPGPRAVAQTACDRIVIREQH